MLESIGTGSLSHTATHPTRSFVFVGSTWTTLLFLRIHSLFLSFILSPLLFVHWTLHVVVVVVVVVDVVHSLVLIPKGIILPFPPLLEAEGRIYVLKAPHGFGTLNENLYHYWRIFFIDYFFVCYLHSNPSSNFTHAHNRKQETVNCYCYGHVNKCVGDYILYNHSSSRGEFFVCLLWQQNVLIVYQFFAL